MVNINYINLHWFYPANFSRENHHNILYLILHRLFIIRFHKYYKATSKNKTVMKSQNLYSILAIYLVFIIVPHCECIKFVTEVPGLERLCFYEVLSI